MQKTKRRVYRPDDADKKKHKSDWGNPEPGLVRDVDGYRVGKCPNDISEAEAQRLLDQGVAHTGRNARSPYPERIAQQVLHRLHSRFGASPEIIAWQAINSEEHLPEAAREELARHVPPDRRWRFVES